MDLNSTQKVSLTLLFTDANGHTSASGAAGDVPAWTNDHPEICDVQVAPDGLSAEAVALAVNGTATVVVGASDNVGGKVQSDPLAIIVTVVNTKIVSVQIVPGPIVQQ